MVDPAFLLVVVDQQQAPGEDDSTLLPLQAQPRVIRADFV